MPYFRLRHNDGKTHLSDFWLDDEFSVRVWNSKEEATQFAKAREREGFKLKVEHAPI